MVLSYLTFSDDKERSLFELSKIWRDPFTRMKYREYYSHQKLLYYAIQALKLLHRLHSEGLYLSKNTTPLNLMSMLAVQTDT